MPILMTLALAAAVQSGSSDKLPPANPLPPPTSAEGQVMMPVDALLAGIAARDAAAIAATLRSDAGATIASEDAGGAHVTHLQRDALPARLLGGTGRIEQRLYDPAVEVDGDIAFVWGRYTYYVDGKPHHCGYDHFDLIRENGGWKIQNITWSSRTTGCDAAG